MALPLLWYCSVALFADKLGGASEPASMATSLVAVLLMLLVVTPDGYRRAGWKALALHKAGWPKWGLAILAATIGDGGHLCRRLEHGPGTLYVCQFS